MDESFCGIGPGIGRGSCLSAVGTRSGVFVSSAPCRCPGMHEREAWRLSTQPIRAALAQAATRSIPRGTLRSLSSGSLSTHDGNQALPILIATFRVRYRVTIALSGFPTLPPTALTSSSE